LRGHVEMNTRPLDLPRRARVPVRPAPAGPPRFLARPAASSATTGTALPLAAAEQPQTPHFGAFSSGRRFRSAPPTVAGFAAAVLEPMVYVGTLLLAYAAAGEAPAGPAIALSLLVLVLTIPGTNRFRDRPLASALGVARAWAFVASVLLLCGWATGTLALYDERVLSIWAAAAPATQWAVALTGHALWHWRTSRPAAARTAIVVGAGAAAAGAAAALRRHPDAPVQVAGFFDDRRDGRLDADAARQRLGGLGDVAAYVQQHAIDTVYITLPLGSQPRIVALLDALQSTTASLVLVPDLFGVSVIQGRLQEVDGVVMVGLCETPFTGLDDAVKRASDLVLATLIIVLTAPLMAALAIGVKLSSPGPVIFRQRRNGLGGEEIVVYKFRSMTTRDDGPVVPQARRGDPRVTRFGAFLRRTSLDELPQFFNVLQGQMSVVGPRPHAVAHNQQYNALIKAYMLRHKVRPGITGLAQVNGYRGETDTLDKMRARVELDLEYLRNWSLGLDLRIIARTLLVIFSDRKAY
jgi:putative colanic acid biosynthesis UDP-glucose lipid carrier transferase